MATDDCSKVEDLLKICNLSLKVDDHHDSHSENEHDDFCIEGDDDLENSLLNLEMSINFGKYLFSQFESFCHRINGYQSSTEEPFWQCVTAPHNIYFIKRSVEIFSRFLLTKTVFFASNDQSPNHSISIHSVTKDDDNVNQTVNIFSCIKRIEYYMLDLLSLCELEYQFQMLLTLALQQFEYVKSVKCEYGPVTRRINNMFTCTKRGRIDIYYEDYVGDGYVVELKLIKPNQVVRSHSGMLSESGKQKFQHKFDKVDQVLIDAFWQSKSYQKYGRRGFGAIVLTEGHKMKSMGVVDEVLYVNGCEFNVNTMYRIRTIKQWLKESFRGKWHIVYIRFFVATWKYWAED